MILKLLIIAAVIATVYFMFFKTKPTIKKRESTGKKPQQKLEANDMVECANCGVYVEVQEAILSNGKYYCSRECLVEAK